MPFCLIHTQYLLLTSVLFILPLVLREERYGRFKSNIKYYLRFPSYVHLEIGDGYSMQNYGLMRVCSTFII